MTSPTPITITIALAALAALAAATMPATATGASTAAAPEPLRSIAILDAQTTGAGDAQIAALFTRALTEAAARQTKAKVIGADEVRGLLDAAAAQALMGCDVTADVRCSVDRLKSVLAVDEIVLSRVGSLDQNDGLLTFVSLVDVKSATVLARSSSVLPARTEEVVRNASLETAARLWSDVAAQTGDRLIAEMRIALLVDEVIVTSATVGAAERASEKQKAVEACVQDELVRAGVRVVAADSIAALKGEKGEALLAGVAPPFLTSREVDAILVARVEYTGRAFAGAVRSDADASLRLVQVDTGTVLAAKQLRQSANGFDANSARKGAAQKLCAEVKPVLAAALDMRRARGNRVVVEARGPKGLVTAADAQMLAGELRALTGVARVDIERFDDESVTLDVVVRGGDGVSLALSAVRLQTPEPKLDARPPRKSAQATQAAPPAQPKWRVVRAEPSAIGLAR